VNNTLFDGAVRIRWGSHTYDLAGFQASRAGQCAGCVNGDPGLMDPSAANFRLKAGSLAIDRGARDGVYQLYAATYGVSIAADLQGTARPTGAAFDIGAFEFTSVPAPRAVTIK
jgi:hypothetical protein